MFVSNTWLLVIQKALTCWLHIRLSRSASCISAYTLSVSIAPCTVMAVLFPYILCLPLPPLFLFPPIIPITLLSGAISICPPHFLLSLSISSCLPVCVCVCASVCARLNIQVCGRRHVHVNVLQHTGASVIECPCC